MANGMIFPKPAWHFTGIFLCVLIYFTSASMSIVSADFKGDILACLTRNLFVCLAFAPCYPGTNGQWGLANGNGNGKWQRVLTKKICTLFDLHYMWKIVVLEWWWGEKAFRANQIQTRIRSTNLVQNVNPKAGNLIYFKTPAQRGHWSQWCPGDQ